jgi:hypothetical protein
MLPRAYELTQKAARQLENSILLVRQTKNCLHFTLTAWLVQSNGMLTTLSNSKREQRFSLPTLLQYCHKWIIYLKMLEEQPKTPNSLKNRNYHYGLNSTLPSLPEGKSTRWRTKPHQLQRLKDCSIWRFPQRILSQRLQNVFRVQLHYLHAIHFTEKRTAKLKRPTGLTCLSQNEP